MTSESSAVRPPVQVEVNLFSGEGRGRTFRSLPTLFQKSERERSLRRRDNFEDVCSIRFIRSLFSLHIFANSREGAGYQASEFRAKHRNSALLACLTEDPAIEPRTVL